MPSWMPSAPTQPSSPPPIDLLRPLSPAPPSIPTPPSSLQPPPPRYPETLNTLIAIRSSPGRGQGVFALADLEPGTLLLSESPLLTLIDTGTRADPLDAAVAALSPEARAAFFALHHHDSGAGESRSRAIVYSNGYATNDDLATGVFEVASRVNHSCVPNASYRWVPKEKRLVFWNRFKLLEGEEVMVDYGHKRGALKRIYGFDCDCGGCTDWGSVESEEEEEREEGMKGIEEVMASVDIGQE